jgi:hypothetical protein
LGCLRASLKTKLVSRRVSMMVEDWLKELAVLES